MYGCWLPDDRTDTAGADHSPDEERNTCGRDKIGFDGEQVADLVDGEPDGGQ
jgi:hypothetical protein